MLSQGELLALREAAEKAWDEDTRFPGFQGHPNPSVGQCYVTSSWLAHRMGGHVGRKNGHYVWLTPDKKNALDLTGDLPETRVAAGHKPGAVSYRSATPDIEVVPALANERAQRFIARADMFFDDPEARQRYSYDLGDAYPGQTPQATSDMDQRYMHDDLSGGANGEYNFVYANGSMEVSPVHSHEDLLGHTGAGADHRGPLAAGTVTLSDGVAFWHVTGNVSPNALARVFKDYTKHAGWAWGGLTQADGSPIDDEVFMGKSSTTSYFAYTNAGELVIVGRHGALALVEDARITGSLVTTGGRTKVQILTQPAYPMSMRRMAMQDDRNLTECVLDWCNDSGYTLLSYNDNVISPIERLDEHNLADPNPTQPSDHQYPVGDDSGGGETNGGAFKCDHCGAVYPTYASFLDHQRSEEELNPTAMGGTGPLEPDSGFPELRDPDNPAPSNRYEDQFPYVAYVKADIAANLLPDVAVPAKRGAAVRRADTWLVAWRHGGVSAIAEMSGGHISRLAGRREDVNALLVKVAISNKKSPSEALSGPLPFIYDIKEDTITTGQPGTRVAEIPGQFTPGGIVDGVYEPNGKCVIHTFTSMPWTANYFLKLWYANFPTLEVKSLHLRDDGGGDTRLASADWDA